MNSFYLTVIRRSLNSCAAGEIFGAGRFHSHAAFGSARRGESAWDRKTQGRNQDSEAGAVSAEEQPEPNIRPPITKSKHFHVHTAVDALSATRLHQLHSKAGGQRWDTTRSTNEQWVRVDTVQSLHVQPCLSDRLEPGQTGSGETDRLQAQRSARCAQSGHWVAQQKWDDNERTLHTRWLHWRHLPNWAGQTSRCSVRWQK